ncbi:D-sedoheptulose 7-phosphate isomerase [Roseiflexus sp. RS-1]|jgi:D-sedoheptulose 7-phosphate isomerase|uniref:Phosphoheptose isomerase n=1 Tax=Roseiflexus sp. (strain RS-1) TaxID=357808 RepID=GMHA_ROSS1|nr:D-sedoheptulose 7-phosphate isomerase [Roseiflexus sp. RS-1]A5UVV6.1 RecName: Full=Phosphoheptose isomerase; AltName: Full=Sedoheptulose 7-phosphate isomerase [Roseiflexus sp. RS-1]ABQ90759.1 phosphoheptose isomerase [Roseiflexus sp. RS-1]
MNSPSDSFTRWVIDEIEASIDVKRRTIETQAPMIVAIAERVVETFRRGGKLLLCGNGGSAADAQHIAAEFVSRFRRERHGLPAIALTTDTSILTAISNDYGYERVFARQVEALGRPGDMVIGISTSGISASVIAAMRAARNGGMATVGFTGASGGTLVDHVDLCLCVPSHNTARIQEVHITVAHVVCEIVERTLFEE